MIVDVTVVYTDTNTVLITNNRGTTFNYEVFSLSSAGVETSLDTGAILTTATLSYDFDVDDFWILRDTDTPTEHITGIIYHDVITALKVDVKDIMLELDVNKILPKNYDFVALALLSIVFFGNTIYQLQDYVAGNLADYKEIALAIEQTNKYLDDTDNTVQSGNVVWP